MRSQRPNQPVIRLQPMFDRPVPASPESEMCALGSIVLDPEQQMAEAARVLAADDFYLEKHRTIYLAMLRVWATHSNLDLTLLGAELARDQRLESVGGADYLIELASSVPAATNFPHYARVIRERARARRLIDAAAKAMHDAYHLPDSSSAISMAVESMASLARESGDRKAMTLAEAESRVAQLLSEERPAMLLTGLEQIDDATGGLPSSGVVSVYGFPSSGKTTLTLAMAMGICGGINGQEPTCVRVVSFEQGPVRVAATLLSQAAAVDVHGFLNKGRTPQAGEWESIRAAMADHDGLDFAMFGEAMDPPSIFAEIAALSQRHKRGVLVIDYIQDIPPWDKFIDVTPRITEAMRIFAKIARELGWLVIIVSQVGKDVAKKNARPSLADALGASAIEQRSDMIITVWRPHQRSPRPRGKRPQSASDPMFEVWRVWDMRYNRACVNVVKNKYGPLASLEMSFEGPTKRFRPSSAEEVQVYPDVSRGEVSQ